MNDQLHILLAAHRGLAEDSANIQHTQSTHFKEVAQHGWAASFQGFRRDPVKLHHIVGDEPVSAAHQLKSQFAFAYAAIASNHHPQSQHVQQDTMPIGEGRDASQIRAQQPDYFQAGKRRAEK